ncbi:DUF2784 domain-containing protein [Pedobacter polaris]|uniref:DUF2784 domain-containing protein n=2 Tax=Pedobacter polaris TaxID=2571273 RepID=A0A4U1CW68_9SPHI|nr:DUF2784 domain-containing protein [Pedobacter polaris]
MMSLMVLDILLTILHLIIIGFNLFGWLFKATKKLHFWFAMVTLGCWTILGVWFGFGYCPITDWQWNIKTQLGEQNLPGSFIKYFADKLTGSNINADLIDVLTLIFFLVAIACSIKVNFFNKIKSL